MGDDGRRRDLGVKRRINGRMVSARVVWLVFLYKMFCPANMSIFSHDADKQGLTFSHLSHNFRWGELGKSDFHQPNWRNWRNSETRNHVMRRLSATTRTTTFLFEALSVQWECSARLGGSRHIASRRRGHHGVHAGAMDGGMAHVLQ